MRMLVTGAAGMLGSGLVPALAAAGHDVVATDIVAADPPAWGPEGPPIEYLDVRDHGQVRDAMRRIDPELVVHLAAETDLERCELAPEAALLTNTIGTKYVALECRRTGAQLAYVSTAGVFDGGLDRPYTEFDAAAPINVYGRSKYEGERIVEQLVERHFITRAGWMVGGGPKDHKFVAKIVAQLNAGVTRIHAVDDLVGAPTYVPDFAACFSDVVCSGLYGRYHIVGDGSGSRYDVCELILSVLGREDVELVPVASSFFGEAYFAPRPRSEALRNLVLELQGMTLMRPWRLALAEYVLTHGERIGAEAMSVGAA